MKKPSILITAIIAITLLSGCTPAKGVKSNGVKNNTVRNAEIRDVEAYCASFVETCPQNEKRCESCGTSVASSYTSCHSKEFCSNIPME